MLKQGSFIMPGPTGSSITSKIEIVSGFSAIDNSVDAGGSLVISNGGYAVNTNVNSSGSVILGNSGLATSTTINSSGSMNVSSGGTALSTFVNSGGSVDISSGGVINNAAVSAGGRINITGGTASDVHIYSNAVISAGNGTVISNVQITSGGIVNGFTLQENNSMTDSLHISNAIVNGYAYLYKNQFAENIQINRSCYISGGSAIETIVSGTLNIENGGFASNTSLYGWMSVSGGCSVTDTTIYNNGGLTVYHGIASHTTMSGGSMRVLGGTANNTVIENGTLTISPFEAGVTGTISNTTLNGGIIDIRRAGSAVSTTLNGGTMNVRRDSHTASYIAHTFVLSGATLNLDSGVCTEYLFVSSGATLNLDRSIRTEYLKAYEGAVINGIRIDADQEMSTSGVHVSNATLIADYAELRNGFEIDTFTASGGTLILESGAKVGNVSLENDAVLNIQNGGVLYGSMSLSSNSVIRPAGGNNGATIDFTVSAHKADGSALINDYSRFELNSGFPKFTITVSERQEEGLYILANNAQEYSQSVTLKVGMSEQALACNGEALEFKHRTYLLKQQDGVLSLNLTISDYPPTTPENPDQTVSGRNVTLTWDASTDDKGVAGYEFRYGTSEDLSPATITPLETTTYSLTNLSVGDYYWQVRAVDTADQSSEWTDVQSFTIEKDDPPTMPDGLTCTVNGSTVEFSWNPSEDDKGIGGYTLVYGKSTNREQGTSITVRPSETPGYTIEKVPYGTYHWWVRAFDTADQGSEWSTGETFKVEKADDPPETPDGLKTDISRNSVSFTWNRSKDDKGYASGYNFRYATSVEGLDSADIRSYTVNNCGLTLPNNIYYWQVQAYDKKKQTSDWSVIESFTVDYVDNPPSVPGDPTQKVDGKSVSFSWQASTDDEGVAGYRFRYSTNEDMRYAKVFSVKNTSYSISKLAGGKYYWQVQAVDTADQPSAWTAVRSFTIEPDRPPTVPGNPTQKVDGLSVTFSWDASKDDYGVSGYQLRYGTSEDLSPAKVYSVKSTAYSPGRLSGGDYYWQVRAIDDENQPSAWTVVQKFTIEKDDPPTVPENPKQKIKNDTAHLSWDASTDDHGVTGYVLRYSAKPDMSSAKEIVVRDLEYTFRNLANGTYYWQVQALDRENQASGWCPVNSFEISYDASRPDAPEGSVVAASPKKTVLTWNGYSQEQAQRIFYGTEVNKYSSGKKVKTSYQVKIDGGNIQDCRKNELPLKGVNAGTHTFEVRAVFEQNGSAPIYTNWDKFETSVPDTRPPKTGKLSLVQIGAGALRASWTAAEDDVGINHYQIVCGDEIRIVPETSLSTDFSGMGTGKVTAYLTAFDNAGNAGKTVSKTLKLKDMTAPDQVTGLAALEVNNRSGGILIWNPGTDDTGVTQYLIEIEGQKTYRSKTNSVKIKKLATGNYKFTVTALDKAKNRSIVSEECEFSVADVIAPKIKKLSASVAGDGASVTWNAWDETGIESMKLVLDHDAEYDVSSQSSMILHDLSAGIHSLDLHVSDAAKNMTSKSITFSVKPERGGFLASV